MRVNKPKKTIRINTFSEFKQKKNIIKSILEDRGYWNGKGVKELYNVKDNNTSTLYAFYDLEKSPSGFDINVFLNLAEHYRKNLCCDSIHVVIVPGSNSGFRSVPHDHRRDKWEIDSMIWRLRHLLPYCCWCLPSCKALSILESRIEAKNIIDKSKYVYPEKYTVDDPCERCNWSHLFKKIFREKKIDLHLRAENYALDKVKNWLNQFDKKVVTISLRESVEIPRNSVIAHWKEFAQYLKSKDYIPVFLRDAEQNLNPILEELRDEIIFPESNHLGFRMALYELSHLNMFVNNGTASLAWFNPNVKYIMCKILSNIKDYTSCSASFLEHCGFIIGEDPPFVQKGQKWIWNTHDNTDILISSFENFENEINNE